MFQVGKNGSLSIESSCLHILKREAMINRRTSAPGNGKFIRIGENPINILFTASRESKHHGLEYILRHHDCSAYDDGKGPLHITFVSKRVHAEHYILQD